MPKLDDDQKRAWQADKNTVVSAGAGSGKTTVLAERYVRLVTERALDIEEVLTLTFTRKAAAEMYARIYRSLAASEHPRAAAQLERFGRARISTLDSFCAAVCRGGASRFGLSPDFRIDERALAQAAAECAVEVLMKYRREPALRRFVAARSFEQASEDFLADFGMSETSFSGSVYEQDSYSALAENQISFLQQKLASSCKELNSILASLLSVDFTASKSKTASDLAAAARSHYPLDSNAVPQALSEKAAFLSSGKFPLPRSNAADPVLVELRPLVQDIRAAAGQLCQIAGTLAYREDIPVFGRIMDEYAETLRDRKRQTGLLSFRDTAELAVEILKKDRNLRNYYKTHIKAIMIDEFQDNNRLQKELLYLICEKDNLFAEDRIPTAEELSEDKLFFVGDEKQSIYRYRGADVSVFRGLSAELALAASGTGDQIALRTNYRSFPLLIDFFNAIFPGVFGEAAEQFEAAFTHLKSREQDQAAPLPECTSFPVEIYLREDEEEGADDDGDEALPWRRAEALCAAERIARMVKDGEAVYGDIAVLFRSTSAQYEYERVFRHAGIPFSAADPRGVYAEGPANDFYAILRLCLFPQDSNAYAAALRSPFAGVGDDCFVRIMLDAREHPARVFPADPPEAWFSTQADKDRYARGQRIYTGLLRKIDLEGLAPLLAWLWNETGYRAALDASPLSRPGLGHFDYLYAMALDADSRRLSLGAFLDELAPLMGTTGKTETGDLGEKRDGVSFMTVHKSKGLEFPVVVIPFAESPGMGDRNDKPWYRHPQFGPVLNFKSDLASRDKRPQNYFYELGREINRKQEEAELKRLFYVAATRAEEKLVIFGKASKTEEAGTRLHWKAENAKGETRLKRTFMDLIAAAFTTAGGDIPGCRVLSYKQPAQDHEYYARREQLKELVKATIVDTGPGGVPSGAAEDLPACAPVFKSGICITSPSALEEEHAPADEAGKEGAPVLLPDFRSEPILAGGDEDARTGFGTLCHRAIELLLKGRDARSEIQKTAETLFRSTGKKNAEILCEEALQKAEAFLQSDWGKEAASAAVSSSEFPFVLPAKEGKMLIRGTMDLIYESGESCVIIDFKTDRFFRPDAHRVQLSCYRAASAAFSALPPRTILYYLRDGSTYEFSENYDLMSFIV